MDSTIRIRQLNQSELSGFVSGLLRNYPLPNISGNLISSGSGLYNIGSALIPYAKIFSNQLNITSGSGINFGGTSFNAYTSGGFAYVNIGGITISSSGESIYIQGPTGAPGAIGPSGATGVSGIGVTGVSYNTATHIMTFGLSNGQASTFNFEGLSGASGVSVTGFFQSGGLIYPQYDNFKGTGIGIPLLAGPAGLPGSISMFFEKSGLGLQPQGLNFPSQVVIDPFYDHSVAPTISLMRGMSYTMDVSGLHTHTLTPEDIALMQSVFTGTSVPLSVGEEINYFTSGNSTGYWRFSFFDNSTPTGFYADNGVFPSVFTENANQEVWTNNFLNNLYRTQTYFVGSFNAQNNYKYGFRTYTLTEDPGLDGILPGGYAYVVGNAYFSSGVGPVGPPGPSGAQGIGLQGPIGPSGQGLDGASVVSYQSRQIGDNQYQVQFIFSNGNTGDWIALPSGGPSGLAGPSGLPGSILNTWRGTFSYATTYNLNDTVTNSGSSFVYINPGSSAGQPITNPTYWQMLAASGAVGATGATGYADRYSSSFFVISGYPTGAGTYNTNITGITVNGVSVSGTGSVFKTGQIVSFKNSGLIGYAYSPMQSLVVSTNSVTGTYFYATVNSYDSANGIISFIPSGGTGTSTTYNSTSGFLWYNWNNATINLGASIVSGAVGPQGIQGIQGPPGAASVLRNQIYTGNGQTGSILMLQPTGTNITGSSGIDMFNILLTGDGTQYFGGSAAMIDINFSGWSTGQSFIIKIRNSGVPDGNAEPPLFYFSGVNTINAGMIKWPNGAYSRPDDGQAYIYTIIRCPDEFGQLFVLWDLLKSVFLIK